MPSPSVIFDAIAPELADSASKALLIQLAEGRTGKVYGAQRDYAVALLAAHMMTMANRSGTSGTVASMSEGQLSESYASLSGAQSRLDATGYGSQLQQLRRESIFSARTVLI